MARVAAQLLVCSERMLSRINGRPWRRKPIAAFRISPAALSSMPLLNELGDCGLGLHATPVYCASRFFAQTINTEGNAWLTGLRCRLCRLKKVRRAAVNGGEARA